ncbi:MOB member 4, phocein [Trapelia coarctata]|nr:MOB member 4, phocein [Trapelia coarctata]
MDETFNALGITMGPEEPDDRTNRPATPLARTRRHSNAVSYDSLPALAQQLMATTLPPTGSLSPSTSPRLPSPPPFPEVQIGPKSPSQGAVGGPSTQELNENLAPDRGASRRIRPGTKAADMASGPPLVSLSDVDSSFQLQEHLKALYYHYTNPEKNNTTVPINRETALLITTAPEGVDRNLWLYELCRLLVIKANTLLIAFFSDMPPCSAQTCPEMRASEWQYLCAVHDPPKSCSAIDYCCHTLDWAAKTLTSQEDFPSRLKLGHEGGGGFQAAMRQIINVFRRVYRMFAHAWFQHRSVFWDIEGQHGLYVLYKTVCDVYNLIPVDNYTVPAEAEGLATEAEHGSRQDYQKRPGVASSATQSNGVDTAKEQPPLPEEEHVATGAGTAATTRRHKHKPSFGSAVTTILEGEEELLEAPDSVSSSVTTQIASVDMPNLDMSPSKHSRPAPEQDTLSFSKESLPSHDTVSSLAENIEDLDIGKPDPSAHDATTSSVEGAEAEKEAATEEGSETTGEGSVAEAL